MQLIGKNLKHWNCSYVMCKQCHPRVKSSKLSNSFDISPMGNGCGKRGDVDIICRSSHNAVHESTGVVPSTADWSCFSVTLYSYHFRPTLLIEPLHEHRFYIFDKEVQRFEHSSADVRSTEVIQFALDNVDQQLKILYGLSPSYNMGDIANILRDRLTVRRILRRAVQMDVP